MIEFWDLYTSEREKIKKTCIRGTVLPKNEFHTIIHAWIRRKADNKFLISKRVKNIFWGGFWQVTGGSAIRAENSLQAAMRECKEELGLDLENAEKKFLFSYRYTPPAVQNASFFLDAWLFTVEENLTIKMQKTEVADFAWLSFEEIIELWKNGNFMPFEQTWKPYFEVLKFSLFSPQTVKAVKFWASKLLEYFDFEKKYENENWTEYFLDEKNKNPNAQLDANLILAHCLNCKKNELLLKANEIVEMPVIEKFQKLLFMRLNGKAVAYLIEEKDFYFYNFYVNQSVLIPKPDTELLVEKAFLEIIDFWTQNREKKCTILDLCCGSGCIGLSVYKRLCEFLCFCKNKMQKLNKNISFCFEETGGKCEEEIEKIKKSGVAGELSEKCEEFFKTFQYEENADDEYFFSLLYKKLFANEICAIKEKADFSKCKIVKMPSLPKMFFSDISNEALNVCKINAKRLLPNECKNFSFVQGDLLKPFLQNKKNASNLSDFENAPLYEEHTKPEKIAPQKVEQKKPQNSTPAPLYENFKNLEEMPAQSENFKNFQIAPLYEEQKTPKETFPLFNFVLTNPPYVPTALTNSLLADGRSEPRLALDGGEKGLDLIKSIISELWTVLDVNGIVFLETGEYNAKESAELLISEGFAEVKIFKDLNEQLRLVKAKKWKR